MDLSVAWIPGGPMLVPGVVLRSTRMRASWMARCADVRRSCRSQPGPTVEIWIVQTFRMVAFRKGCAVFQRRSCARLVLLWVLPIVWEGLLGLILKEVVLRPARHDTHIHWPGVDAV